MDGDDCEGSAAELRNRLMSDKACLLPVAAVHDRRLDDDDDDDDKDSWRPFMTTKDQSKTERPPFFRLSC